MTFVAGRLMLIFKLIPMLYVRIMLMLVLKVVLNADDDNMGLPEVNH